MFDALEMLHQCYGKMLCNIFAGKNNSAYSNSCLPWEIGCNLPNFRNSYCKIPFIFWFLPSPISSARFTATSIDLANVEIIWRLMMTVISQTDVKIDHLVKFTSHWFDFKSDVYSTGLRPHDDVQTRSWWHVIHEGLNYRRQMRIAVTGMKNCEWNKKWQEIFGCRRVKFNQPD